MNQLEEGFSPEGEFGEEFLAEPSIPLPAPDDTYVYDGDNVVMVFSPFTLLSRYLYGTGPDEVLAEDTASQTRWFLSDHQGSVRGVANSSGEGNITRTIDYNGFGKITGNTGSGTTPRHRTARGVRMNAVMRTRISDEIRAC